MGKALFTLNVPVIKTSSAILAMTEDEVAKNQPTACINCGDVQRYVRVRFFRYVLRNLRSMEMKSSSWHIMEWNAASADAAVLSVRQNAS